MKNEFPEFYRPTEAEFEALWAKATIILDTNSLLNLYRTPNKARDEFFNVLKMLADRLWMPHQVGLEFQRNRLNVITAKGKTIEEALVGATNLFEKVRDDVQSLELDKYGLNIETNDLIGHLKSSSDNLSTAIRSVHEAQIAVALSDTIRETLDDLYQGKVGFGPKDAAELANLTRDGDKRYDDKIPPGFSDKDKDKNPNEAFFIHNGLKYQRKFGDLIIWRQLLEFVKLSNIEAVILVTADKKEDWWKREEGKTVGPHPELIRELHRETGLSQFWMYSPDQFMSYAAKYANATISKEAVAEVRDVSRAFSAHLTAVERHVRMLAENVDKATSAANISAEDYQLGHRLVASYLERRFQEVEAGFYPDFEISLDGATIGFEVIRVTSFDKSTSKRLIAAAEHVHLATSLKGRFIYLIVIMDAELYVRELRHHEKDLRQSALKSLFSKISENVELGGIYFGVFTKEVFTPVYFERGISWDVLGVSIFD